MRIWTVHPKYLDRQGLLAAWREGLLARKVLLGKTRGYRSHPQLDRFRQHANPVAAISTYLAHICSEADRRGYHFKISKLHAKRTRRRIIETTGQLYFEWEHLKRKLIKRHGQLPASLPGKPEAHPFFKIVPGHIRPWEKITGHSSKTPL